MTLTILRQLNEFGSDTGCDGPDVIPTHADVCASFQYAVVSHLCKKIQRGMIYADTKNLIPDGNRILVRSL
jgi:tRNA A37 threonylcarbamoyltransferase TsaD